MARLLLVLILLALPLAGCKKKDKDAPPKDAVADGDKKHFDFRPPGGSSTVLGKARDRALDIRLMNEMGQVNILLEVDLNGRAPADKAAWLMVLRELTTLRKLVDSGEVVAFTNVDARRAGAGTVLMYETRIETENDGIVLTCDGKARRVTRADFAALTKPAK